MCCVAFIGPPFSDQLWQPRSWWWMRRLAPPGAAEAGTAKAIMAVPRTLRRRMRFI
jgi:hypothetical protein